MVEQLSKKDAYWRKIAFNICKDKSTADDLVNDMYLKLYDCKKRNTPLRGVFTNFISTYFKKFWTFLHAEMF